MTVSRPARRVAAALAVALVASVGTMGCGKREEGHGHPGHKAHHGGALNAVGGCETGHAEVKVAGDRVELWFVGGGSETGRAVRVAAKLITLDATLPDGTIEKLTLEVDPLELAGEEPGDASHFVGRADWLRTAKSWRATGRVEFKGAERDLVLVWPEGWDPGHGHD
jgi:hypothetical protein